MQYDPNNKYRLVWVDPVNWAVDIDSPHSKDPTKKVTRRMGYYNRLDQAVSALYNYILKDEASEEVILNIQTIQQLTEAAYQKTKDSLKAMYSEISAHYNENDHSSLI